MNKVTDIETIIANSIKGDQRAMKAIYDLHSTYLFGVCKRYLQDINKAEEGLSDAFITAFKKLKQLEDPNKLRPWLKTIAVRACLNIMRKKKMEFDELDLNVNSITPLDDNILTQLSLAELKKYIDELPIGYRNIFNLYVIEGYSHKEIAEMLNIKTGTSKSQLNRAKQRLQMTIRNNSELPKGLLL